MLQNLLLCFNSISPLLLLILFGYYLRRISFISGEGFAALDKLCFKLFVPIMLFCNIYTADLSSGVEWSALIFMWVGFTVIFLLSFFLTPIFEKDNDRRATLVHGFCHNNIAVLGIPLIFNIYGGENSALYALLVAASSPLVNALMVFEHEYFRGKMPTPRQLLMGVFTSPYLIGSGLGLIFKLLSVPLPAVLLSPLSSIKALASPLCLIALGGAFTFASSLKYKKQIAATIAIKSLAEPLLAILPAIALGFRGAPLLSLSIVFACPCAAATYSYSVGMSGDPQLAAQMVVYSTLASIASIFLWVFALLQTGMV